MTQRYEPTNITGVPSSDPAYHKAYREVRGEELRRRAQRQAQAYNRALAELRRRHQNEFDELYAEAKAAQEPSADLLEIDGDR